MSSEPNTLIIISLSGLLLILLVIPIVSMQDPIPAYIFTLLTVYLIIVCGIGIAMKIKHIRADKNE